MNIEVTTIFRKNGILYVKDEFIDDSSGNIEKLNNITRFGKSGYCYQEGTCH